MNLLDVAIPPQVRLGIAGAVLLLIAGLSIALYVSHLHNTDLTHRLAAMTAEVDQARESLKEAKANNDAMVASTEHQAEAMAALEHVAKAADSAAAASMRRAADLASEARQRDLLRKARPDMPPPTEMTAATAEAVGGI